MGKPKHRNVVEFCVYGKYALFSDVITRASGEKFSYRVPTYESLKGILKAVYWKPTLVWTITDVRVMNPIRMVRKGMRPIKYTGGNDLAFYTYLEDVCYQVRAYFEWNLNRPELECDRNEHKHHNLAKRMISRGGRRSCWLGTSECYAYVEPCVFGEGEGAYDNSGKIELGNSFHSFIYSDEAVNPEDKGWLTACFWEPVMENGIITFLPPEDCKIKRKIRPMSIKPFGKDLNNFSSLDEEGLEELAGGDDSELDE